MNLTRKFSIFSPKKLRDRIEVRQDRYLSMRKLTNRAARAQADLARSGKRPYGASLNTGSITNSIVRHETSYELLRFARNANIDNLF